MRVAMHWLVVVAAGVTFVGFLTAVRGDDPSEPAKASIIGRWDLTVKGQGGDYPSWLEVRKSGYRTLVGSFVGRTGSARPISRVEFQNGNLRFTVPPQWEMRKDDLDFKGRLEGTVLHGESTDDQGRRVNWTGLPAPSLKRDRPPKWGQPVALFDGRDLDGWEPRPPAKNSLSFRLRSLLRRSSR